MPIAKPTGENSREIVLPNYLQLLLGGLLLALLLCIPIIAFTNHAKRAATVAAPVFYPQTSADKTSASLSTEAPEAPVAQPQTAGVSLIAAEHKSTGLASNRTTPPHQSRGFESQETGLSKRILRKLNATPAVRSRSSSPALSRVWFRTSSPRQVKAALIAIWHQTFKRPQKHQN